MRAPLPFQQSLFDAGPVGFDPHYGSLRRIALPPVPDLPGLAWMDYAPGWVRGADALFEQLLAARKWGQRERWMYESKVREPRLTSPWSLRSGAPLRPSLLESMRRGLGERYGVEFDSIGFNLYRDGRDSVAWHSDHIDRRIEQPVIALVSVGEPRKFLLRPKGGGASHAFMLGRGDLLVTGGMTQRAWEHAVPKVAHAGPRISLAFRYGLDPRAYAHKREVEPDR